MNRLKEKKRKEKWEAKASEEEQERQGKRNGRITEVSGLNKQRRI